MIWVKKHDRVLAACDEDIIGKKFSDGRLELHLNEDFYKGKLIDEVRFSKILDGEENINIVGKKAVEVAVKKSLIADVKSIRGVPYAIIFRL